MGQLAVLLALLTAMAGFTDLPERIRDLVDESIRAAQQIATAGDLRSMSTMLDYHYMRKGKYPRRKDFDKWLAATFKENNLKEFNVDHWGNRYVYRTGDGQMTYVLISPGPDGKTETADDLRVSGP